MVDSGQISRAGVAIGAFGGGKPRVYRVPTQNAPGITRDWDDEEDFARARKGGREDVERDPARAGGRQRDGD